ncbi:DUF397 domain-containing protein [Streptomyces sp. NPDC088560]|uniref:DUF397 domain-containing protein n=1 Tax=Streptomyces sp. NPDC088560 TaxID=3365868 RepID=UPI0037F15A75
MSGAAGVPQPRPPGRDDPHGRHPRASCVEIAANVLGAVPVRDSKDPEGPALSFPPAAFAAFVTGVKGGVFGEV